MNRNNLFWHLTICLNVILRTFIALLWHHLAFGLLSDFPLLQLKAYAAGHLSGISKIEDMDDIETWALRVDSKTVLTLILNLLVRPAWAPRTQAKHFVCTWANYFWLSLYQSAPQFQWILSYFVSKYLCHTTRFAGISWHCFQQMAFSLLLSSLHLSYNNRLLMIIMILQKLLAFLSRRNAFDSSEVKTFDNALCRHSFTHFVALLWRVSAPVGLFFLCVSSCAGNPERAFFVHWKYDLALCGGVDGKICQFVQEDLAH